MQAFSVSLGLLVWYVPRSYTLSIFVGENTRGIPFWTVAPTNWSVICESLPITTGSLELGLNGISFLSDLHSHTFNMNSSCTVQRVLFLYTGDIETFRHHLFPTTMSTENDEIALGSLAKQVFYHDVHPNHDQVVLWRNWI